jgi:hypothetical protein
VSPMAAGNPGTSWRQESTFKVSDLVVSCHRLQEFACVAAGGRPNRRGPHQGGTATATPVWLQEERLGGLEAGAVGRRVVDALGRQHGVEQDDQVGEHLPSGA